MTGPFSKLFFPAAALFLFVTGTHAIAYGDDRAGMFLLLSFATACLVAGMAGLFVRDELPDFVDGELNSPAAAEKSSSFASLSMYPMMIAIGAVVTAIGFGETGVFVGIGVAILALGALGLLSQTWSDDGNWTNKFSQRLGVRVLQPVLLPVGAFLAIGVIALSVSRVLLTVSQDASVLIALVASVGILVACAVVASAKQVSERPMIALGGVVAFALVAAGALSASQGERTIELHDEHKEGTISASATTKDQRDELRVEGVTLHKKTLDIKGINFVADPAEPEPVIVNRLVISQPKKDAPVELNLRNFDDGILHNIAIYGTNKSGKPDFLNAADFTKPIWNGLPVDGGEEIENDFPTALKVGEKYQFRCDFHPTMVGELRVESGSH